MTHPPVPFDPELAAALAALGDQVPTAITPDMIAAARQATDPAMAPPTDEELSLGGTYTVAERVVPGPADAPDISLLICTPAGADSACPAIYYTHGGGMILGDNRNGMAGMVEIAARYGAVVVSVEYRLAPETRHPGPIEDVYAGLVWTAKNAAELGIDPDRILIAGGSAGGGLTAALGLLARDRGGPAVLGQLLMCPMLDDRNDSVSAEQMAGRGVWDRTANATGWGALLGDAAGGPDVSPYAAPARATDLSGLPPAFIDVGSAETFRDEDVAYATAIWQAGGRAELHVWPGGYHGFEAFAPAAAVSQDAKAARLRWLDRLFA
ncbi:alpha/beta hydrolase [Paractinoplanes brasiliensis]|uniref:Acetyl esterase/lipase n=1 Tax=Paractinoplanes brasiliensis TaxID=52695 RepID=A0A4R6JL04_9ACTN|nr:alpha/beta hydrolase [Actinoplanes brasiliensis]TDO36964.1 acetyl esterase/lipase [Actinoplanes brasiliensis]GID30486.1 esterase [Actinoplanes brasiliensis]